MTLEFDFNDEDDVRENSSSTTPPSFGTYLVKSLTGGHFFDKIEHFKLVVVCRTIWGQYLLWLSLGRG